MAVTTPQQANVPLLHRFLGIGQVLLAAVFLYMTYAGFAPTMPRGDETAEMISYAFAGVAGVLSAVGFLLTGTVVIGIVMAAAISAFWMNGPDVFSKGNS